MEVKEDSLSLKLKMEFESGVIASPHLTNIFQVE